MALAQALRVAQDILPQWGKGAFPCRYLWTGACVISITEMTDFLPKKGI